MTILEVVASSVGEFAAYGVGRILGRTFHLEATRAQAIGEYVILGTIMALMVSITLIYS